MARRHERFSCRIFQTGQLFRALDHFLAPDNDISHSNRCLEIDGSFVSYFVSVFTPYD